MKNINEAERRTLEAFICNYETALGNIKALEREIDEERHKLITAQSAIREFLLKNYYADKITIEEGENYFKVGDKILKFCYDIDDGEILYLAVIKPKEV